MKSRARYAKFVTNLALAEDYGLQDIQGPAHGFISLVASTEAAIDRDQHGILLKSHFTNTTIRLVGGSEAAFRRALLEFATCNIQAALQFRVQEVTSDETPGPLQSDLVTKHNGDGPIWIDEMPSLGAEDDAEARFRLSNALREAVADSIGSVPDTHKRGRKDMGGITPRINGHATFYATHNCKSKRKKQPMDTPLTVDDYADGLTWGCSIWRPPSCG